MSPKPETSEVESAAGTPATTTGIDPEAQRMHDEAEAKAVQQTEEELSEVLEAQQEAGIKHGPNSSVEGVTYGKEPAGAEYSKKVDEGVEAARKRRPSLEPAKDDQTLAAHPGLLKGSDQGRMIDHVYNEQILDFVMYGHGERIPPGMTQAFEHVYTDNIHAVSHMSAQGDANAANAARVWVETDGLYQYFKDAKTGRYTPEGGSHHFRQVSGRWHWDGIAEVVNPQMADDLADAIHPFDVTINGERVSEIAVHLPIEGTGQVQIALGQTTVPGADPNRVVVWRLTGRGGEESFRAGRFRSEVEVPDVKGNKRMDPTLKDEMVQFLQRSGWKGGSKDKGRVLGTPEFKVTS